MSYLCRKTSFRKSPVMINTVGLQRRGSKMFMMVLSVTWNDERTMFSKLTIYRSTAEFIELNYALKAQPKNAAFKSSIQALIKIFPKRACFSRKYSNHVKIMDQLEAIKGRLFCTEEAVDFLLPTEEDRIHFANDTYKMYYIVGQRQIKNRSIKVVPIRTSACTATGDFIKQDEGELSITQGEELDVLIKDDSGWWFVRRKDQLDDQGWIPASYVDVSGNITKSIKRLEEVQSGTYIVIDSHTAESAEEVSVQANSTVEGPDANIIKIYS